jgi:hypothetical protein
MPAAADSAPPIPTPDRAIARIDSYESLLAACRAQVQALGINYQILDLMAGYADGYATKLLGPSEYCSTGGRRTKRHFSPESFNAYVEALGVDLLMVENPAKVAKLRSFCESKFLAREGPIRSAASDYLINFRLSRDFMRRIGRKGALARAAKLHAQALRRERSRRAALARWSKRSAEQAHHRSPDGLTSTAVPSITLGSGEAAAAESELCLLPSRSSNSRS